MISTLFLFDVEVESHIQLLRTNIATTRNPSKLKVQRATYFTIELYSVVCQVVTCIYLQIKKIQCVHI